MNSREINLTPAELKAIGEHKHFLSQQLGAEISIEEAIEDFLKRFAEQWRQEKLRRDNLDQRQEIDKHKWLRSEREGHDIGRAAAANEWCERFAHIWRAERESLEQNGFQRVSMVMRLPSDSPTRPWSGVRQVATRYDCEVYVHKDGLPYWNFLLEDRPFMNVKSILNFLSLGIVTGDTVEFVAMGPHATEALTTLTQLLTGTTTE